MLVRRIATTFGVDRNPLRRRTDRIEAWLTIAVMTVVLLVAPVVAWRAGAAAYGGEFSASEREERLQRFQVEAVLLGDTTDYVVAYGQAGVWQEPVPARWIAPDGTPRTGSVVPQSRANAGTTILIWTDPQGNLLAPPASYSPHAVALGAGLATALGLVGTGALVLMLIRKRLDERRMASWRTEWMLVEPGWSGRR
jgi:hypothetical protein